jgi:hypothetical protein
MTYREFGSLIVAIMPRIEDATGIYSKDYWSSSERKKIDAMKAARAQEE